MKVFYLLVLFTVGITSASLEVETLPPPVFNRHSFSLLSNSRYSVHSGFTGSLPTNVLANILWGMARVPRVSNQFEIYVATPTNLYRYDPENHTLILHLTGNRRSNSNSAFEIGIASDRYEDAGFAIQVGQLAGVAFWDSAGSNVVSCPMQSATNYANNNWQPNYPIRMVNVYGRASVRGLDTTCLARSSDSTLPLPQTIGSDTFEVLLLHLRQDSIFSPIELPIDKISQLLWSAYGVTPHTTANGRRGLTVPSAVANYYITGKIYLVKETGVYRYRNRLPSGSLTTADHRLELHLSGDRREQLRSASRRIPATAPVYIVIGVGDTTSNYHLLEAGFAGIQLLLQANSLNLSGFLTVPLTPSERSAIRTALELPPSDFPALVFSGGEYATFVKEPEAKIASLQIPSLNRTGFSFDLFIASPGVAHFTIYDLTGQTVRSFKKTFSSFGHHPVFWDGKDETGRLVRPGIYFLCLKIGERKVVRKLVKTN